MKPLKIIVATDSYKGSKTSMEAAKLICKGARRVFPEAQFTCIPIADGGEGTLEAIINFLDGETRSMQACNPLGQPIQACYGLGKSMAIMEISAASGLTLVPHHQRNPLQASSYGSGQILNSILNEGHRRIIIGIGGSATNDGGAGIMQALGYSLKDKNGQELPPGGAALSHLHSIDDSKTNPALRQARIEVICDVDNPLCGPQGASATYGPQKGANPRMVKQLDSALAHFACKTQEWFSSFAKNISNAKEPPLRNWYDSLPVNSPLPDESDNTNHCPNPNFPGAGAAGGIGFGLMAFCGAHLRSGIETMLDISGFNKLCLNTDLVITGEGRIDGQSIRGKVPLGVAARARRQNIPVLAIVGGMSPEAQKLYQYGIDSIMCTPDGPISLQEAMARSDEYLPSAAERACRMIRIGMKICKV